MTHLTDEQKLEYLLKKLNEGAILKTALGDIQLDLIKQKIQEKK